MSLKTLVFSVVVLLPAIAAAAAPDWCKPMAKASSQYYDLDSVVASGEALKITEAIVGMICKPRDEADVPKAEAARKQWSTTLEMTSDKDWEAAAQYWANYDQYAGPTPPTQQGFAGLDPLDQYLLLANYSNVSPDGHYVADAAAPLSEAGRLGYAIWCVRNNVDKPAHWAACAADVAGIDLKKVVTELRADKTHDMKLQYRARVAWYDNKAAFAAMLAKIDDIKKKDPGYVEMFKVADKSAKDWTAAAAKRQKLIALAGEMDNARITQSRKASTGCEEKTLTELRSAVGTIDADKFAGVLNVQVKMQADGVVARGIVGSPEGYLAAAAYTSCKIALEDKEPDSAHLANVLGAAMQRWAGYRGVHSAVIADIMQAGIELDRRGDEIGFPDIHRDFFDLGYAGTCRGDSNGVGIVASVKAGKPAAVTYEKRKVTYPTCVDYVAGKHITGIMANGQFEYAGTCRKYKDVTDTQAVSSTNADGRFVAGVKPGQSAVFICGVPYATWSPSGKAPATILGVPVK